MAIKSVSNMSLADVHPGVRVVKTGQADVVCLGDVATAHFDRYAASGQVITRKAAWRLALRDFGQGVYELAPERPRPSRSKVKV
jgi:hypothetical protein